MNALQRGMVLTAQVLAAMVCGAAHAQAPQVFFDDFHYDSLDALRRGGWTLRDAPGHPGVPGARWLPEALQLASQDGQRVLRLTARTDGTPQGTVQSQLCHARKLLNGTYAARVRFTDAPESGIDGDPVVQTFYAVAPLKFDFDPEFSEIDWEYLPNGGWGSEATRLYAIAWQTVRIEPWLAFNQPAEVKGSQAGWRVLTVQVRAGQSRWFVDGREVALHGGRNHPVQPMAISFNLWFSPTGLLPASEAPRVWVQDVDWVLHAADAVLSPDEVLQRVAALRREGVARMDAVPAPVPALTSPCSF